ncbi:MAG: hypothetical protein GTO18_12230 [Anaerolineales bacterium]|nr:hypothetical protein [Anaerolineales bacterium]
MLKRKKRYFEHDRRIEFRNRIAAKKVQGIGEVLMVHPYTPNLLDREAVNRIIERVRNL